jgi:glycine dehydrogenase subunit 1
MVEAIRMDIRQNKSNKKKVLLSEGIHPYILKVLETYFPENVKHDLNIEFEFMALDEKTGSIIWEKQNLKEARSVVVMNPTKWGTLEKNLSQIKKINPDITLIYGTLETLSLSVLQAPSELGTDIVFGDAQSLGIPVSFGGPSLGFLAARESYTRQMPGRFIGKTEAKNREGETVESYVITLSTREQHIRREKATSNICSNQSLMAIRAAAYMAFMGWPGMQKVCVNSRENREYFQKKLVTKGVKLFFPEGEYFHEVAWVADNADDIIKKGFDKNVSVGTKDSDTVIISYFSELISKEDIDKLLEII